jgi:hypothetical protein
MSTAELGDAITNAGFTDVSTTPLSLGICWCYRATAARND